MMKMKEQGFEEGDERMVNVRQERKKTDESEDEKRVNEDRMERQDGRLDLVDARLFKRRSEIGV